jgi:ubiquinone/menaquinone biosynthesis C-methylase UbiE
LRWIDIGCGNGALTELLVERCRPVEVQGIDPSEGQLAFARTRPAARVAEFRQGDAMALPFPASRFDAAVMALVLAFVPDPAKGIAEMVRPPQVDASRMEALRSLWMDAGLEVVQMREIAVTRTFADFSEFWMISSESPALGPTLAAMSPRDVETLQSRLRARLPVGSHGRITCRARAHAIKGRRPE